MACGCALFVGDRSYRINDKGETENNTPVSFPRPRWIRLNRHYERAVDTVRILTVGRTTIHPAWTSVLTVRCDRVIFDDPSRWRRRLFV